MFSFFHSTNIVDTIRAKKYKKLHFSGTEVAPQVGGYIEGALEAAENVLNTLNALE